MPLSRPIKARSVVSFRLNSVSIEAETLFYKIMFAGIDREGRMKADPNLVKSSLYPCRNFTYEQVEKFLDELYEQKENGIGLIELYEVEGQKYLSVPEFHNEQTTSWLKAPYGGYWHEAESKIPPPPKHKEGRRASPPKTAPAEPANVELDDDSIPTPEPESNTMDSTLPGWIDRALWDAFLEMRKERKAVQTDHALSLIVKDLEKFKAAGDDPNAILKMSITNSWKGVFPLKGGLSGTHQQNPRALTKHYTKTEDL